MRIIISPAKKMRVDEDSPLVTQPPAFLPQSNAILRAMQERSDDELQQLWKCNDALATLNIQRLRAMDLSQGRTPAILAYEGIQYRYLAPTVLESGALDYLQEHLRIVSGLYGLLRPLDGVTPYRLELQSKLAVDGHSQLYDFWGDTLARALAQETDCVLNLASKEYSHAIAPHLPSSVQFCTCTFAQRQGEKLVEKGTFCKMARGEMVRFLAENGIASLTDVTAFDRLGYGYLPEASTPTQLVFCKDD